MNENREEALEDLRDVANKAMEERKLDDFAEFNFRVVKQDGKYTMIEPTTKHRRIVRK